MQVSNTARVSSASSLKEEEKKTSLLEAAVSEVAAPLIYITDRKEVSELLQRQFLKGRYDFSRIDPSLRDDPSFIKEIMSDIPSFSFMGPQCLKNRDLLLKLVELLAMNPHNFHFVDPEIKKDKAFIITLLKCRVIGVSLYKIIEHIDESLKLELLFFYDLVKLHPYSFNYASEKLKRDVPFALYAVQQNFHNYIHLEEDVKNNPLIVSVARVYWIRNPRWASLELRNDQAFMLEAIENNPEAVKEIGENLNNEAFLLKVIDLNNGAFKEIMKNESLPKTNEMCRRAVQKNARHLQDLPYYWKGGSLEQKLVEAASEVDPFAMCYASFDLKMDKVFGAKMLKKNGLLFKDVGSCLNTFEFAKIAVESNPFALQFVNFYLQNEHPELVHLALEEDGLALEHVSWQMRGDLEIALRAVRKNGLALQYVREPASLDEGVVKAAYEQNKESSKYVHPRLQWYIKTLHKRDPKQNLSQKKGPKPRVSYLFKA